MNLKRITWRPIVHLSAILCALIVVGIGSASAADPPSPKPDAEKKEKPVSFWMEKKLEYSQDILRGLVVGDLKSVGENAEQMRLLSKVEGWIRRGKPGYRAQMQVFELANTELLRTARTDNLDGATLAFQQLTVSCVSCHKILRNVD